MLSRENRIRKKKDIERIFKRGRTFKEAFLILKTLKNDSNFSRFGFIVSQKVSKKANVRNKIKRRLREIIRLSPFGPGTDNLFIFLPGADKVDFLEIKQAAEKLLNKAKIK